MKGDFHVRFCERLAGEIPACLLDVFGGSGFGNLTGLECALFIIRLLEQFRILFDLFKIK